MYRITEELNSEVDLLTTEDYAEAFRLLTNRIQFVYGLTGRAESESDTNINYTSDNTLEVTKNHYVYDYATNEVVRSGRYTWRIYSE